MIEYDMIRERQEEAREAARRQRLVAEALRSRRSSRGQARIAAGTALARLGLVLGGPAAVRAALRSAR
jgi:hypothetical protein